MEQLIYQMFKTLGFFAEDLSYIFRKENAGRDMSKDRSLLQLRFIKKIVKDFDNSGIMPVKEYNTILSLLKEYTESIENEKSADCQRCGRKI